ncbi:MAG: aminotransferase class V-fold PLP-dependent enzyme, partial [Eubacterium sp.]|nr:aminotransferase class V-fold PLP-dependent enzyme [Eubacterium sp.]
PKGWEDHEKKLLKRAEIFLSTIPGISIIGKGERAGCISFVSDKKEAYEIAAMLDQKGIALRSGNHCAQILHRELKIPYSVRISPAFYNTTQEIDDFLSALKNIL